VFSVPVAIHGQGWVGFGISQNGGMKGADLAVILSGRLLDLFR
jgi:hypothetical protein